LLREGRRFGKGCGLGVGEYLRCDGDRVNDDGVGAVSEQMHPCY
jgi:hypothetical protein